MFDFEPSLVVIIKGAAVNNSTNEQRVGCAIMIRGNNCYATPSSNGFTFLSTSFVTWGASTVSWYAADNYAQANGTVDGFTINYYWAAVG